MLSVGLAGGYFAGRGALPAAPQIGKAATAPPTTASTPAVAKKAAKESRGSDPARANPSTSNAPRSLDEIVAKLRQAMADPNYMRVGQGIFEAAQHLAPADIPAVLAQLKGQSAQRNFYAVLTALMPRWAEADPEAALAYAQALTRVNERQMALAAVFSGWARHDVEAAIAAVERLKSSDERRGAWAAILPELAQTSPERALELHQKHAQGGSQYGVTYGLGSVHGIFHAWAQNDPAGAAAKAMRTWFASELILLLFLL